MEMSPLDDEPISATGYRDLPSDQEPFASGGDVLLSPRVSERLLMDALTDQGTKLTIERALCGSLGRAQLALAVAKMRPGCDLVCNFLDLHQAELARRAVGGTSVRITCEPDEPVEAGTLDLAALPLSASGDAEWTRERLQAAHVGVRRGGQLWVATDNPRDKWLRAELEKLFERVQVRGVEQGVVYVATKTSELKKRKDYTCWFAFRDQARLLQAVSRPGVFSHRHVDAGARCLMETMELQPDARVFELGSGAGVVACAAAARGPSIHVLAIDSNPRAVQCTRWAADANGLAGITTRLEADGRCDLPGSYDLALANPPYYSHQRISRLFVDGARQALRPGGTLLVVTKDADWYVTELPRDFSRVEVLAVRSYYVVRAQ